MPKLSSVAAFLILMAVILALAALVADNWVRAATAPTLRTESYTAQSMSIGVDVDTGCEYIRFTSAGWGISPRMEGYGRNYHHRGCRR